MQGLMMKTPLTITALMCHAERLHGDQEIVSITGDHGLHRYRFRDCLAPAARLVNVLAELGMRLGDRIGTLAWNDYYRHIEQYFAIPCSGGICHTLNPRRFVVLPLTVTGKISKLTLRQRYAGYVLSDTA
jgi:fatty-acyl-CoA synthase